MIKYKKLKPIIIFVIIILITVIIISKETNAASELKVILNGDAIKLDKAKPYLNKNGSVLIPASFIAEKLGIEFFWLEESQIIEFRQGNTIHIKVGENKVFIDYDRVDISDGKKTATSIDISGSKDDSDKETDEVTDDKKVTDEVSEDKKETDEVTEDKKATDNDSNTMDTDIAYYSNKYDKEILLEDKAVLKSNTLYVPLSIINKVLNFKATYSKSEKIITITTYENTKILPIPDTALRTKFCTMTHPTSYSKSRGISAISYEKCLPGPASWQQIEPIKGQYHWEYIDEYVRSAQRSDKQIVLIVWPFTNWDQEVNNSELPEQINMNRKDPREDSVLALRKGKPSDMKAYQTFLSKLVERFDGDGKDDMVGLKYPIQYWQICDEPDMVGGFQGSSSDYYDILKTSYQIIKKNDPEAKVVLPPLPTVLDRIKGKLPSTYNPYFGDMDKLFELGASKYFDIYSVSRLGEAEKIMNYLKKYELQDKPIWIGNSAVFPKGSSKEEIIELCQKEFDQGVERILVGDNIEANVIEAIAEINKAFQNLK